MAQRVCASDRHVGSPFLAKGIQSRQQNPTSTAVSVTYNSTGGHSGVLEGDTERKPCELPPPVPWQARAVVTLLAQSQIDRTAGKPGAAW